MTRSLDIPLSELEGKVAFITGGSSGIGLGIARACAAASMKVVITYRTERHLARARECLQQQHADFHAIMLDVSDRAAMVRAAEEARERFGDVDLLCSNAGVGIATSIRAATRGDWDYVIGVNIGGLVNALQAFLPGMLERAAPAHIVATASMSGIFHGGSAGLYTTTKFAVVGLMEALRAELRPEAIGVSVCCPGLVQSNISLANRNRPPSDDDHRRNRALEDLSASRIASLMTAGMDPMECGERVLDGVRRNDMYILTHSEYQQGVVDSFHAILRSFPEGQTVPPDRLRAEQSVLTHPIYVVENER
jgi:NAD(P)-dependent dehydrogenase (short-subunit alcohol dehydrogenase family)